MSEAELYRRLGDIRPSSVVVVGDVILDKYLKGNIERISPEGPVGVLDCNEEEYRLGGAANVAGNLKKLGCKVALVGAVGRDDSAKVVTRLLKSEKIDASGIVSLSDRPTIQKTRLMAQGQQLMRVDKEQRRPLSAEAEVKVLAWFAKNFRRYDGVVLSDYNKGFLTPSLLKGVIGLANKLGKKVIVDPKGDDFSKYRGADVLTPNRLELETATGMKTADNASVEKAARKLIRSTGVKSVLATRGPDGMAWFPEKGAGSFFPTVAKEVFDVTGAGDTVVAVFTCALLGGLSYEYAAMLSNHAGGLQVAHLGAVAIGFDEIRESLAGAGGSDMKVVPLAEASNTAERLRRTGKKVVFTNGCFDLIHFGHIQYLQKARKLGDWLVLGLNSDSSVRKLKGEGRPVINEKERAHVMAALSCIDQVVIFSEPTPIKLIRSIKPDYLVKGGDYKEEDIVGYKDVKKWGGSVRTVNYVDGNSTTNIIDRIKAASRE